MTDQGAGVHVFRHFSLQPGATWCLVPLLVKGGVIRPWRCVLRVFSGQAVDFTRHVDDTGDTRPTRISGAEIVGAMVIMESSQRAFRCDTGISGPALDLVASPA